MLIMTGILLAKFENYRIRKVINSLGSYITDRKQTTQVNDDVSALGPYVSCRRAQSSSHSYSYFTIRLSSIF